MVLNNIFTLHKIGIILSLTLIISQPLIPVDATKVELSKFDSNHKIQVNNELVILSSPVKTDLEWGEDSTFTWEVVGATNWYVYKNSTLINSGELLDSNQTISIPIKWQEDLWRLGMYNLTLEVINTVSKLSASAVSMIQVNLSLGDEYVNTVLTQFSVFFIDEDNIIGPPDNIYGQIYTEYGNGYITLDMGENEEILNQIGPDFEIIAKGGEYAVKVKEIINEQFISIGNAQGNNSFDIESSGFNSIRYIRIEYYSGEFIDVDAVVSLSTTIPEKEFDKPIIESPTSIEIQFDQVSTLLSWRVSDRTPWNYSIEVDNEIVNESPWTGTDITFLFEWDLIGEYEISLIVFDLFENWEKDVVKVEVFTPDDQTQTSNNFSTNFSTQDDPPSNTSSDTASLITLPFSISILTFLTVVIIVNVSLKSKSKN